VGMILRQEGLSRNGVIRVGPMGEVAEVQTKRYLVPGVERTAGLGAGGEGRGLAPGPMPEAWMLGSLRVGAILCVEVLYPRLAARLRRDGAQALLQLSNESMLQPGGRFPLWADAPRRQQEAELQLRAAEFRLPAVRATLGGRAGGFGPDGRPLPVLALHELTPGVGRWIEVALPPAGPPPLALFLLPLTGPLSLILLLAGLLLPPRGVRLRDPLKQGGAPSTFGGCTSRPQAGASAHEIPSGDVR
jgi:hypothetical protein